MFDATLYEVRTIYTNGHTGVCCVWPGQARDTMTLYGYVASRQFYIDKAQLRLLDGPNDVKIFRAYISNFFIDYSWTPYFLTYAEAVEYARWKGEKEGINIDSFELASEEATLITFKPQLPDPLIVHIDQGADGRFSTHISSHPEIDGTGARGKVFFPDKSWKDVTAGRAKVKIVKEFDTYGFITGEMLINGYASKEQMLTYTWESDHVSPWDWIEAQKNKETGDVRYILVTVFSGTRESPWKELRIDAVDGNLILVSLDTHEYTDSAWRNVTRREVCIEQLMDIFQISEEEVEGILNNFVESKCLGAHFTHKSPRLQATWVSGYTTRNTPNVVDKLVQMGYYDPYYLGECPGVQMFQLRLDQVYALTELTLDEIKCAQDFVNSANAEADKAITQACRNGRLRVY